MSMYASRLFAIQRKEELDACVRRGIKSLNEEGFTREKLLMIIENESGYQKYHRIKWPKSELPLGTKAMVLACEILLNNSQIR